MPIPYVPLNRVFQPVSDKELEDTETLLALADSALSHGGLDWNVILEFPRVLILAQGGVGKTREMQEQASILNQSGQVAFFIPLERLDDDPMEDVLGFDDGDRFESWLHHDDGVAWFFLDSVDELKTSQGTLERALQKFARSLGRDALRRAKVILSCRPKDWSETIDRPAVQSTLELPPPLSIDQKPEEDSFVASLIKEKNNSSQETNDNPEVGLKVVMLLPLDRKRTRLFAEAMNLPEIDAFMNEVTARNADELVKRPMDLVTITDMWREHRRLGTRREQLELNIKSNLIESEESHHQRGALSLARALEGAKRIALGMALAKRNTIYAEAPSVGRAVCTKAVNAERLLDDWDEDERARLLRLPIFDLAALGQVRFHHRSIKDFLAAEKLHELSRSNLSNQALRRLLIAEKYGETVVIPSMRDISAWLALKNDRLRSEILRISPEVLIAHGDPEALPVHEREELLFAFAKAHGVGGWRGLGFDITQLRRLSDPRLGKVVRKIWDEQHENAEVLDLLIDMIRHGPLGDCVDLAESVAFDPTVDERTRAEAVRALIACRKYKTVQRFVDDVLVITKTWKGRKFLHLFDEFVPKFLSVKRFVRVLHELLSIWGQTSDLDWKVIEIAGNLPPLSIESIELRDELARLIESGAYDENEEFYMKSHFGQLREALALLCTWQIESGAPPSEPLVYACVIASRFESEEYSSSQKIENLVKLVGTRQDFREAIYWEDVALLDRLFPDRDQRWRAWRSARDTALISPLIPSDAAWLENALITECGKDRALALHLLLDIWRDIGRPDPLLKRMRSATDDMPELAKIIDDALKPVEESADIKERIERLTRRQRGHRAQEHLRLSDWRDWRHSICANPSKSFDGDEEEANVTTLIKWVAAHTKRDVSDGPWSSDAVVSVLGEEVLRSAFPALKRYWRKYEPLLWSERKADARNTFSWPWLFGLCALNAEATEMGWSDRLSDNEIRLATRYAFTQLGGLPEFLDQLIDSRPAPVLELLSKELEAQFDAWDEIHGDLPLLQTLRYGGQTVQRLLAPTLAKLFESWPRNVSQVDTGRPLHGLSHLIDIVTDKSNGLDTNRLKMLAQDRFQAELDGPFSTLWLIAVFKFDFEAGVNLLTVNFENPENPDEERIVVELIAALFGHYGDTQLLEFQSANKSDVLGRLLSFTYKFVRPEKDRVHHGVFTSNARDHASSARSSMLGALIETPGANARRVLLELADAPQFSSNSDRWRMLSLEQLAIQAEFVPYDIDAIQEFERHHQLMPRDSEELLGVVMDRLYDLAHDLHHHKFPLRKEWRDIEDEADAQRLLAARLDDKHGNAYTAVTREEEVAERNRTDVTLWTSGANSRQTIIEIKIANKNRTANSLASDIDKQLVEKYLRHEDCRAGCFLVVNKGDKKQWKNPETDKMFSFSGLIEYLERKAKEIEERRDFGFKLSVFGLDLTDEGAERHAFTSFNVEN